MPKMDKRRDLLEAKLTELAQHIIGYRANGKLAPNNDRAPSAIVLFRSYIGMRFFSALPSSLFASSYSAPLSASPVPLPFPFQSLAITPQPLRFFRTALLLGAPRSW